jgi:O-antigen ligase
MRPFFVAHGVYAAVIAFFIPILVCNIFFPRKLGIGFVGMTVSIVLLAIFLTGIFFSYTRAAWLSLLAAGILVVPILLRIKFRTQLILLVLACGIAFTFQNDIVYLISKNKQASAEGFSNHLQSVSNIKTDASNTERINRWMSAIDMFRERPVLGFGPGTYSFCYAPFQQSRFRTEISTDYGDGGNAHSEYLNPLAESGLFGMLTFVLILLFSVSTAYRLIYTATRPRVRILSTGILLGLITYYLHGFLNNYSETDKVAAIFWGSFAMLVAMDMYHNRQPQDEEPAETGLAEAETKI